MLESNLARFVLPSDLELLQIKTHKGGYLWVTKKVRQEFEVCPKCANLSKTRAGRCSVTVRDESLRSEKLWLKIHKHRYFCKPCQKTFTEPVSLVWPRRRTTQRFRKALSKACTHSSDLAQVRAQYNVSTGLIYSVFYEQLETKLRERKGASWPEVIGVDEHFFKRVKGVTEFVTVFCDLRKKQLFEVALSKRTKELIKQLDHIPGREKVKVVVIDLSSGYRAFVKKMFPNAVIVADKFHVLRLLSPAIMKGSRSTQSALEDMKTRRKLLRSRRKLEYFERFDLDRFLEKHPDLDQLYRAKEKLYELYRTRGIQKAFKAINKLIADFRTAPHPSIQRLGRTLQRWRSEILLYFESRYTNGFTEAMNSLGKLVQKRAFGYKKFENYRLRLLTVRYF